MEFCRVFCEESEFETLRLRPLGPTDVSTQKAQRGERKKKKSRRWCEQMKQAR
jgi:hypothetical protein